METIIWRNNKERKLFIHDLKNPEVGMFIRHRIQKGESIISNFKNIYRKAKFITRENEDIERVLDKIPINRKHIERARKRRI